MANIADSAKTSLEQLRNIRAGELWPQVKHVEVRFWLGFADVDARVTGDAGPEVLRLCRLRYGCSASL